jgi:hypothetical protein
LQQHLNVVTSPNKPLGDRLVQRAGNSQPHRPAGPVAQQFGDGPLAS